MPSSSARYLLTFESFRTGLVPVKKKMFGLPPRFGEMYQCEFFGWFMNVVLWKVDLGGGVVCLQFAFELAPS